MEYRIFSRKMTIIERGVNKVSRLLFNRNLISPYYKNHVSEIDIIYPVQSRESVIAEITNIGWIPDFQEKYLPQLFSTEAISNREKNAKFLKGSRTKVVFSSNDARNDYLTFYNAPIENTAIFRFTSKIPSLSSDIKAESVLKKYNVTDNQYLFCGNQFWVHKNHLILFEAIKFLKESGYNPILLCTGNPKDNRAKEYYQKLSVFIDSNKLRSNIRILGLIDRNEQLILMQKCMAVIQPSLFEGWNTSIEEAKALNKMLIVSDLNVHKEQVVRNGLFFKRDSAEDLAEKMKEILDGNIQPEYYAYSKNIKEAAETFINILDDALHANQA